MPALPTRTEPKLVLIAAHKDERQMLSQSWGVKRDDIWIADIPSRRIGWADFLARETKSKHPGDFVYLTSTNSSAIFSEDERSELIRCVARFAHENSLRILMRLHPSESRREVRQEIRKLCREFSSLKMTVDRVPALIRMAQARFIVHISRSMAGMSSNIDRPSIVFRAVESRSLWKGETVGPSGINILDVERDGVSATATSCDGFVKWAATVMAEREISISVKPRPPAEKEERHDSSRELALLIAKSAS